MESGGEGKPPSRQELIGLACLHLASSRLDDYSSLATVTSDRRLSFTRGFPRAPELDALVEAFERGDYAHVRKEAPKLVAASTDKEIRRSAMTLIGRTKPDAVAVGLLVLAAIFVGVLSWWWIAHGHPPPGSAPRVEYVR